MHEDLLKHKLPLHRKQILNTKRLWLMTSLRALTSLAASRRLVC